MIKIWLLSNIILSAISFPTAAIKIEDMVVWRNSFPVFSTITWISKKILIFSNWYFSTAAVCGEESQRDNFGCSHSGTNYVKGRLNTERIKTSSELKNNTLTSKNDLILGINKFCMVQQISFLSQNKKKAQVFPRLFIITTLVQIPPPRQHFLWLWQSQFNHPLLPSSLFHNCNTWGDVEGCLLTARSQRDGLFHLSTF